MSSGKFNFVFSIDKETIDESIAIGDTLYVGVDMIQGDISINIDTIAEGDKHSVIEAIVEDLMSSIHIEQKEQEYGNQCKSDARDQLGNIERSHCVDADYALDIYDFLNIEEMEDTFSGIGVGSRSHIQWSKEEEIYTLWLRATGSEVDKIGDTLGRTKIAVRDRLLDMCHSTAVGAAVERIMNIYEQEKAREDSF